MTAQVLPIVRTVPASIKVWTAINRKWGKTKGTMPVVFPHLV